MNRRRPSVWLVQHREGECVIKDGKRPERDSADNVETLCGHWVVLPWAFRKGRPDCAECRILVRKREDEERESA